MKGAITIAIILLMIGAVGMIGTHTAPQLSIFSTSLQNSPELSFTTYAANGAITSETQLSMEALTGLFSYGSNPVIISTWSMNGLSSAFGDVGYLNVTHYTMLSMIMMLNITWNILFYSPSNGSWQTLYPNANHENFTFTSGTESAIAFPTFRIAHPLSGIVQLQAKVSLYTSSIGIFGGAYHKNGTMYREVYIVPGSGTINVSPTVQQVGGKVYIHGQVNFGSYYVLLFGSTGYNGGSLIQNFSIQGQNTFYNFTYVIPPGAFSASTNPNYNEWSVELWNSLLAQHTSQFFTVDHLNLVPPKPTIKITNTPANDMWTVGQNVNIIVHAPSNNASGSPVSSIIVWVYYNEGGEPAPGSSLWIIDNQDFGVTDGNATFSFQIPDLVQSIAISTVSVDSQGRASNMTTVSIQASQITTGGASSASNVIALAIMAIIIALGSVIIWIVYPGSPIEKLIVIAGLIGMMAMLYFPIYHWTSTIIIGG